MEALKKWVARHQRLSLLLSIAVVMAAGYLLHECGCPTAVTVPLMLVLCVVYVMVISTARLAMLTGPLTALSKEGDPEPLFRTTQELLRMRSSPAERQQHLINHAVALREMGELARAREILMGIDMEHAAVIPYIKAVYYHNLSDILDLGGDAEGAEAAYRQAEAIYRHMKEDGYKRRLKEAMALAAAAACRRAGDADGILALIATVTTEDLPMKTAVMLLRAEAALLQNDREEARRNFEAVVGIGNKLYAVTLAKERLAALFA